MEATFEFFENIEQKEPVKTGPKTQEEQWNELKIGKLDPDLVRNIIHLRRMVPGPGMPIRRKDGTWELEPETNWFPSRGSGRNGIMIVGAYPSDDEKRQKKVMTGPSATIMSRTLSKMGIRTEDCILTNVIHYYLPAKTKPTAAAIQQCQPYLEAEIEFYKPKLILCLGGVALATIMEMEVSMEEYRGERFRMPGKDYEVAVVWHPAHIAREASLTNTWEDDLLRVLGKKPLPPGATNYVEQNQLPVKNITALAELKKEVAEIVSAKETTFSLDAEFVGENPGTCILLNIQIGTPSRTLNIIPNVGWWKPKIFPKNAGKNTTIPEFDPGKILNMVAEKGYTTTSEETGVPKVVLVDARLNHETEWKSAIDAKTEALTASEGVEATQHWKNELEREENKIMTEGNVMVFNEEKELEQYLFDNPKMRSNLIAYVVGADYVFDASLEEIGNALRPLFEGRTENVQLWGHSVNVDITRVKRQLKLDLTQYNNVDTMLLALMLDEGQPRGLEDICRRYLNAPNHKLELLIHMKTRGLKGQSYCFVKPSILNPYAALDARRNHDVVAPMLVALEAETARIWSQIKESRVPKLKIGETAKGGTLYDDNLAVNDWPSATYLYDAFFQYKMPQSRALVQPMELGQPINTEKMGELIDWYETGLKKAIKKCQDAARPFWHGAGEVGEFKPSSPDQTAKLLFIIKGLRPIKSTNKKDKEWTDAKHKQWEADIKADRKPKHKPATDGETLELLAEKDELAKTINDTRFIGTIVKNYLRKGGRWRNNTTKQIGERGLTEAETGAFQLMDDESLEEYFTKVEEEASQEREETRERWNAHDKDQTSKSLSLLVSSDNRIYSNYYATLESHRLATVPNVSAIIKGESRYVKEILGDSPPCEIRQLNEDKDGWFILSSDWKSAEVWMIGILSWLRSKMRGAEMQNLLKIISDPTRCVHSSTARKMFPRELEGLTDQEIKSQFGHLRDMAKPVVFGIPYGRGAGAIAAQLNRNAVTGWLERVARGEASINERPKEVTPEEAELYIDGYFEMAPECWDFLTEQKSLVQKPGFQINPWGFVRRFPKPSSEEELAALQREASNWQIQGGVAISMAMSMSRWKTRYVDKYPRMRMYLIDILHDALKFVIHKSMLPYYEEIIDDVMGKGLKLPFEHPVPLGFDISFYKAYERKEFSSGIELECPDNPKKHKKTFLGKYGDTPENRAFFAEYGKDSDFNRFLFKYGVTPQDLVAMYPKEVALQLPGEYLDFQKEKARQGTH